MKDDLNYESDQQRGNNRFDEHVAQQLADSTGSTGAKCVKRITNLCKRFYAARAKAAAAAKAKSVKAKAAKGKAAKGKVAKGKAAKGKRKKTAKKATKKKGKKGLLLGSEPSFLGKKPK